MKKACLILAIISSCAQADIWENRVKNHLASEGFNPDGGVTIVSNRQLAVPDTIKQKWKRQQEEQKNKGYYSIETTRAKELMEMHKTVSFEYNASAKDSRPESSHLRQKIDEIKMAYTFEPVPRSEVTYLLGFAAVGGYDNGWNGVVEFFNKNGVGSCAYTENNIKLSHGTEKIDEDIVRYDINGKITTLDVHGTDNSGFLYTVHWVDDDYFHDLECASSKYSSETTHAVIALAKRVDMR